MSKWGNRERCSGLTAPKILLDGNFAIQLWAVEGIGLSSKLGHGLDGLSVAQMRSRYPKALDKCVHLGPEARVAEGYHGVCQVARRVKGRGANVDIDHQLVESRTHRGIKAFPRFKTSPERHGRRRGGWEEEPITADQHATTHSRAIGMGGEDEIQSGNNGEDVVATEVGFTCEMAGSNISELRVPPEVSLLT